MKNSVVISFGANFKFTRENLYSRLREEQNLREVVEWRYILLSTPDEVEKHVEMTQSNSYDNCIIRYDIKIFILFDPGLQMNNPKKIKNQFDSPCGFTKTVFPRQGVFVAFMIIIFLYY